MVKFIKSSHLNIFYSGLLVSIAAILSLYYRWEELDAVSKLAHIIFIGFTFHEFEEYRFPAGFVWGYHTVKNSPKPDRYPGNKLSCFIVNVSLQILGVVFLFWFMNPIAAAVFGMSAIVEVLGHTLFGIIILKRLRSKGKETIYFPGSATCWFIFLPFGLAMLYELVSKNLLDPLGWLLGFVCTIVVVGFFVILPEEVFKNIDSPYGFETRSSEGYLGYFKKFF